MVDPTAWANIRPNTLNYGDAVIRASQAGTQNRLVRQRLAQMEKEDRDAEYAKQLSTEAFEAWKSGDKALFQEKVGALAPYDRKAAGDLVTFFGTLDRTNFVNASYHVYNAARGGGNNEVVNRSLLRAKEGLNLRGEHPYSKEIDDIIAMDPGKEKDKRVLTMYNAAAMWGAFGDTVKEDLAADRLKIQQGNLMARWVEIQNAQTKEDRLQLVREFEMDYGGTPDEFYRDPNNPTKLRSKPGSKVHQGRARAKQSLISLYNSQITKGDRLAKQIEGAIADTDWTTSGTLGFFAKYIPGIDASNLQSVIQTISANIGFDKLQELRDQSPTGGALGQVAVEELKALQASIANLEQTQSPSQLRQNLALVLQHYKNYQTAAKNAKQLLTDIDIDEMYDTLPENMGETKPKFNKDSSLKELLSVF